MDPKRFEKGFNIDGPDASADDNQMPGGAASDSTPVKGKGLLWLWISLAVVLLCALGGGAYWYVNKQNDERVRLEQENQATQAAFEKYKLEQEVGQITSGFSQLEENYTFSADSAGMELQRKFEEAKLRAEQLEEQLRRTEATDKKKIAELEAQIATLKGLLKHYIEEIDRLNKENESLRNENAEIKSTNESLQQQVSSSNAVISQQSTELAQAKKLNVSGVSIRALNKKGKTEKKVQKAQQLCVTFTVTKNTAAPVGEKVFYLRIVSPTGELLGSRGTFSFDGGQVPYTERKAVEYTGEEISGVNIYWDCATSTLSPGEYTVELFTEGYRVWSKKYSL